MLLVVPPGQVFFGDFGSGIFTGRNENESVMLQAFMLYVLCHDLLYHGHTNSISIGCGIKNSPVQLNT